MRWILAIAFIALIGCASSPLDDYSEGSMIVDGVSTPIYDWITVEKYCYQSEGNCWQLVSRLNREPEIWMKQCLPKELYGDREPGTYFMTP